MNESIIGERFGRLVVIGYHHSNKYKSTWWLCKCDCGNEKIVYRGSLTSGDIISCGCYREEHKNEYGKKHGLVKTPLMPYSHSKYISAEKLRKSRPQ